jgi:hypothetical protein
VSTVEATFANGHVERDAAGAAVFALIIPANVPACELRALDAAGKILLRIDLSTMGSAAVPACQRALKEGI